jgi:hypothetical protein
LKQKILDFCWGRVSAHGVAAQPQGLPKPADDKLILHPVYAQPDKFLELTLLQS